MSALRTGDPRSSPPRSPTTSRRPRSRCAPTSARCCRPAWSTARSAASSPAPGRPPPSSSRTTRPASTSPWPSPRPAWCATCGGPAAPCTAPTSSTTGSTTWPTSSPSSAPPSRSAPPGARRRLARRRRRRPHRRRRAQRRRQDHPAAGARGLARGRLRPGHRSGGLTRRGARPGRRLDPAATVHETVRRRPARARLGRGPAHPRRAHRAARRHRRAPWAACRPPSARCPVASGAGSRSPRCSSPTPDLLLLDEPTNHLDVEGVAWLADHLVRRPPARTAVVAITHDRWFLDAVATQTWEVDDGVGARLRGRLRGVRAGQGRARADGGGHRRAPRQPAAQGARLAAPRAAGAHEQAQVPHRRGQRPHRRRAAGRATTSS